jgi:hypothetical protein
MILYTSHAILLSLAVKGQKRSAMYNVEKVTPSHHVAESDMQVKHLHNPSKLRLFLSHRKDR